MEEIHSHWDNKVCIKTPTHCVYSLGQRRCVQRRFDQHPRPAISPSWTTVWGIRRLTLLAPAAVLADSSSQPRRFWQHGHTFHGTLFTTQVWKPIALNLLHRVSYFFFFKQRREAGGFLMSPPLPGISGLSVWSHFSTSSLLVFCLVLLLFLSYPFSAFGPFSWPLFP